MKSRFRTSLWQLLLLTSAIFALPGYAQAAHSVALSWSEVSPLDPAVSYNICRSTAKGAELPCGPISNTTALTWTDNTVAAGTTYYYVIVALDAAGKASGPSNEVVATVPTDGPAAPVQNAPVIK
jgi:fibronectin type 3 domain-containing protein